MKRLIESFVRQASIFGIAFLLSAHVASAQYLVTIIQPTNGAAYSLGATIQILATANNVSGSPVNTTITNVTFYENGVPIPGTPVLLILDPPGVNGVTGPVYFLNWTPFLGGSYKLTAVVTDNLGVSSTSAPVNITVGPISRNPVVRITSPPNHAVFFQPVDIPIYAFADVIFSGAISNSLGSISNVEFYANTIDLGPGHHVLKPPPPGTFAPTFILPNDFTLTWSNALPGVWSLTAVATDNSGMRATSAPVNITVVPTKIITNGLDVVSIVASAPMAVNGTNNWVWPGLTTANPTWAAWKQPVTCLYTNCGPIDAVFTVRRVGENTNDVTVNYSVGGTASNGVDYVYLPGTVTIPAGRNYAFIDVIPLNSSLPIKVETVKLTLQPDTNAPPDYVVGLPSSAVAIILDRPVAYPATGVLPGSLFHLNAAGPDGAWFCVEKSTDLQNWSPVSTNQVFNGSIDFVDPNNVGGAAAYYQPVPLMTGPDQ
jgi:hypothetical protein